METEAEKPKCVRCGAEYVRIRDHQRYCSPRCQLARKAEKERAKAELWRALGRPSVEEIEAKMRAAE
jgi:predicted nucleic acid-binding Zn ribbon protein